MSLLVDIRKQLGSFDLDVSLEAENGVTCLLGASGCGKSYTLKCIAGIEKPDRGHIELDGTVLFDSEKRINLPPQKRRVGYLFQNYALFPNMTVRQNILCGLHGERDKGLKERKLQEILRTMQLEGLENHRPAQLSGGQQQRVALARILVNEPKLLMLDEPSMGLAPILVEQIFSIITELHGSGVTVLLVEQNAQMALQVADRSYVMETGLITMQGDASDLLHNDAVQKAYLGS